MGDNKQAKLGNVFRWFSNAHWNCITTPPASREVLVAAEFWRKNFPTDHFVILWKKAVGTLGGWIMTCLMAETILTHKREEGLGWSIPPKFLCDLSTVVILVFSSACIYLTSSLTRHAGIHDKTANKSIIVRDLVQNIPATSDAQKKMKLKRRSHLRSMTATDSFAIPFIPLKLSWVSRCRNATSLPYPISRENAYY